MIGWTYECLCMLENTSALVFVPVDELRIMWFFTNIPCVFILLGQRAGWVITAVTVLGIALGNQHLSATVFMRMPSPQAFWHLLYFAVAFHVYVDRSISYFKRMRDYNLQLVDMASHDPLTKVLNGGAYYRQCDQLIHASQRSNQAFAVLFLRSGPFQVNQ